jgi:ATP-dependent RNA helicase RhlE
MLFNQLGLSAELLSAVEKQGYREATPVQREAIPPILEGRDILASAQTGTGKTAGFTLPLLQRLQASRPARRHVRALILVPTRELAAQVSESVRNYGCHLPIRSMQIYGGVSIRPQISRLREGVDIVVATPGRLLDHVQQKTIDLSSIEVLVLDEADRMLDMGFIRDIRKILKLIPAERQNLLFSATFSKEIRSLASSFLRSLLSHRIGEENWRQVLVFTRTKHGANRLAQQLSNDGLHAVAIHGNKSQGARTKALKDFKSGKVRVLVATDIAARGLDIDKLPHVVNFELPHVPEDYVHRIGRTARAGLDGHAVSLVCVDEEKLLRDIERLLKRNIQKEIIPGYEPDPRIKAEPIRKGRPQRPKSRRNDPRKQRTGASNGHGGQHRGSSGRRKRA